MTLKQAAPPAKLSLAHLSKIELGSRELNQETMGRIASALIVPPADLLRLEAGGLSEDERLLIDTYREVPDLLRVSFDALRDRFQAHRSSRETRELD